MFCEIKDAISDKQIADILSLYPSDDVDTEGSGTSGSFKGAGNRLQFSVPLDKFDWMNNWIEQTIQNVKQLIDSKYNIDINVNGGVERDKERGKYGICALYGRGCQYVWHRDWVHPNHPSKMLNTRKITLIFQLTDEHEYVNGDLRIKIDKNIIVCDRSQKSAIAFTSDTLHSVTTVTKGTRKSLVFWIHSDEKYA